MRVAAVRRVVAAAEARESLRSENSPSDDEDSPAIPFPSPAASAPSEVGASASSPRDEPRSANGRSKDSPIADVASAPAPVERYLRAVVPPPSPPEVHAAVSHPLRAASQPAAGRATEVEVEARWPIVRPENSVSAAAVPADPYPRYARRSPNSQASRVGRYAVESEAEVEAEEEVEVDVEAEVEVELSLIHI